MLTPQQIQQAKSTNGVNTNSTGAHIPMSSSAQLDDSSFESWATPTTAAPKSGDKRGLLEKAGEFITEKVAKPLAQGEINTVKALKTRGENLYKDTIKAGSEDKGNALERGLGAISYGAKTGISAIVGGVGDIISNMSEPFIPQEVKDKGKAFIQEVVTKYNTRPDEKTDPEGAKQYDKVHAMIKNASDWLDSHPITKDAIKTGAEIASLGAGKEAETAVKPLIQEGANTAGVLLKEGIENAKSAAETAKPIVEATVDKTKGAVSKVMEKTGELKDKVLGKPTVEEAVGKVAQGSKDDVPSFARGLKNIDMKNIKTYDDLAGASEKTISKLAEKQKANLATEKSLKRVEDFKVNVDGVEANYVNDALEQLKAHYEKTNNAQGLAKVKSYYEKANAEEAIDFATNEKVGGGLTVSDVNEIAKLHGRDLNGFNANGELASGLSKQAAENTRKGLKTTVKENLTDPKAREEFEMYDKQMSDTFTVKELSQKYSEAVNKLNQKLEKPNILQKLTTQIGKAMKYTGVKSFLKEIGLGKEGATTLNAVEIEAKLPKLLKIIDEGMKDGDDAFVREILKLGGDKK